MHLLWRLRGGGHFAPVHEISVAPRGLIRQNIVADKYHPGVWDRKNAVILQVQILNANRFFRVTGIKPPPVPMSAARYDQLGLPNYKDINTLRSIEQSDDDLRSSITSWCEVKRHRAIIPRSGSATERRAAPEGVLPMDRAACQSQTDGKLAYRYRKPFSSW